MYICITIYIIIIIINIFIFMIEYLYRYTSKVLKPCIKTSRYYIVKYHFIMCKYTMYCIYKAYTRNADRIVDILYPHIEMGDCIHIDNW